MHFPVSAPESLAEVTRELGDTVPTHADDPSCEEAAGGACEMDADEPTASASNPRPTRSSTREALAEVACVLGEAVPTPADDAATDEEGGDCETVAARSTNASYGKYGFKKDGTAKKRNGRRKTGGRKTDTDNLHAEILRLRQRREVRRLVALCAFTHAYATRAL